MATKRRAQPKKPRSAKHRTARVAVRRASGPPPAGAAVFKREPAIIADESCAELPADLVEMPGCAPPVLCASPSHPWFGGAAADVPRETFPELEEDPPPVPVGLLLMPKRSRRWIGVVLVTLVILGLVMAGR